jgi:hypothetical protein
MPQSDAALLLSRLTRFRRRATLALWMHDTVPATAGLVLVAEAMAVWQRSLPDRPIETAAALLAAACAIGLTSALVRRPTLRLTARAVDERAHLRDRVVTAFQCRAGSDAISRLVLRDAIAHLDSVSPAAAFPLRLPRAVPTIGALAVGVPLAVAAVISLLPPSPVRSALPSTLADAMPPPGARIERDAAMSDRSGRRSTATADARVTTETIPPSEVERATQPQAGRPPSSTSAATPGSPQPDADTPAGGPGTRGGRGPGQSVGTAAPADAGIAAAAAGGPAEGRGGVGAGRGGAAPADSTAGTSTGDRSRDGGYAAAWAAAEAALPQERIPPRLREYVRRYFSAIRPAAEQP